MQGEIKQWQSTTMVDKVLQWQRKYCKGIESTAMLVKVLQC